MEKHGPPGSDGGSVGLRNERSSRGNQWERHYARFLDSQRFVTLRLSPGQTTTTATTTTAATRAIFILTYDATILGRSCRLFLLCINPDRRPGANTGRSTTGSESKQEVQDRRKRSLLMTSISFRLMIYLDYASLLPNFNVATLIHFSLRNRSLCIPGIYQPPAEKIISSQTTNKWMVCTGDGNVLHFWKKKNRQTNNNFQEKKCSLRNIFYFLK